MTRQALWLQRRRRLGLCVSCPATATQGHYCAEHWERQKEYARLSYQRRTRKGRVATAYYLSPTTRRAIRRLARTHGLTQSAVVEMAIRRLDPARRSGRG